MPRTATLASLRASKTSPVVEGPIPEIRKCRSGVLGYPFSYRWPPNALIVGSPWILSFIYSLLEMLTASQQLLDTMRSLTLMRATLLDIVDALIREVASHNKWIAEDEVKETGECSEIVKKRRDSYI
ncbi:hypothetical protein AcW1_005657 [Taiwanofungus camphoratus]|nr:hypothetical protein AcW2_004421 [Antrodia cinnamomea]KAI0933991.1 hypothetical protein AcV5_005983 [Antrodia cinnamomea]KAI0957184.1 hypothetical protein AcW1_005657 [Antrodia cinnamomea]